MWQVGLLEVQMEHTKSMVKVFLGGPCFDLQRFGLSALEFHDRFSRTSTPICCSNAKDSE